MVDTELEDKEKLPLTHQTWWQRANFRSRDLIAFLLLLLVTVYILYSLVSSIWQNYKTQQEIQATKNDITRLKLEKERLQSLLVYYDTKSYQEIELRRRLLLKKPGEIVVALRGAAPLSTTQTETSTPKPTKTPLQEWYDYYFRHP